MESTIRDLGRDPEMRYTPNGQEVLGSDMEAIRSAYSQGNVYNMASGVDPCDDDKEWPIQSTQLTAVDASFLS